MQSTEQPVRIQLMILMKDSCSTFSIFPLDPGRGIFLQSQMTNHGKQDSWVNGPAVVVLGTAVIAFAGRSIHRIKKEKTIIST